uniref:Uncharacterized protein n=1 Tax=Rhizophora mucronata TaxID=61149 RepID=A0A2P2IYN5_RHIMU
MGLAQNHFISIASFLPSTSFQLCRAPLGLMLMRSMQCLISSSPIQSIEMVLVDTHNMISVNALNVNVKKLN